MSLNLLDPTKMSLRTLRLAALSLACAALACGHKGPPLPPPLMNPAPTYDLKAQQRGDELILAFTYPLATVSGLPLATVEKVEYWRLVKPLTPAAEEGVEGEQGETGEDAEPPADESAEPPADEPAEPPADEPAEPAVDVPDEPAVDVPEEEAPEEVVPLGATPQTVLPPPPTKEQIAAVELLEFDATAELELVLEGEELTAATVGDQIVLRLPFAEPAAEGETAYIYAVKTYGDARRVSTWSNLATLVRRPTPPVPTGFEVEAEAGGVRIRWQNERAEARRRAIEEATAAGQPPPPPEALVTTVDPQDEKTDEAKAYRIYRRDAQARVYPPYIGQALPDADEYLDRTAQYGSRYIYGLTAVGLYSPLVESSLAGEIEIGYEDRFAPPAPLNPIALAEPGRVRLLWDASPAPDLRGYVVFRRQPGEQDFRRLNNRPLVDLEYDDREVAAGTDYQYRVAAVDREGNQGEPSATVTARVP